MRRVAPRDVLVGLAAFLVVAAVMTHLLSARGFATSWPADTTTTSTARGASFTDPATLAQRRDATLVRRRSVTRTPASTADVDSLQVSTSTTTPDGSVVARSRWLAGQRRVTGEAVDSVFNTQLVATFDGSGDAVEKQSTLRGVRGVLMRFPRDTQPRSYRRWDPETRRTGTAVFERRERLGGAEVLRFRQRGSTSPATGRGTATTSDTTLWVRPEVGAVVRATTRVVVRTLPDGTTSLDATFEDDPGSVRRASDRVDRAVGTYRLTAQAVPAAALALGLLAAAAAVVEGRTRRLSRRMSRRAL